MPPLSDEHQLPALLQHYLANRDEPCPSCRYNLRNLTTNRCPECGDELRLRVALADPHLAPYFTLLLAAGIAFGGGTLFGLIALKAAPARWWFEPAGISLAILWIVAGAGFLLNLRYRQRIRRLTIAAQWRLAAIAWAIIITLSSAVILLFED
jgi:hypothetical protein